MEESKKCPKCNGEMEAGMTVEYKSPGGMSMNINMPKKQTWGKGIKPGFFVESVDEEKTIVTHRCKTCGYLESYAN